MLTVNCPWNDQVVNNHVNLSSEIKVWDGQVDNNKGQRQEMQQRRIHRERNQRRWKCSLGECRRTKKCVMEAEYENYKKVKGIISEINLEDDH